MLYISLFSLFYRSDDETATFRISQSLVFWHVIETDDDLCSSDSPEIFDKVGVLASEVCTSKFTVLEVDIASILDVITFKLHLGDTIIEIPHKLSAGTELTASFSFSSYWKYSSVAISGWEKVMPFTCSPPICGLPGFIEVCTNGIVSA